MLNKKILAVIAVVVVVASVCGIGVWYYALKSQEKTGFTDVIIKDYSLGSDSITINIMSIPPEYSGEAKLEISYGGSVVYPEHTVNINKGYGSVAVPYNEFVTENGNYTVEVLFKNKTATTHFNINFVVEDVTILANAIMDGTPKIWVQIPLGETADVSISIDIIDENGEIFNGYENKDFNYYNTAGHQYEGKYPYEVSGNYTIRANWTNNKINEESPYKNPSPKTSSFLINLAPVAKASPATQETSISEDGGWAYFYGGNSTDYDDDDNTLIYMWSFDTDHDDTQISSNNTNDTRVGKDTSYQYTEDDLGGILHLQPKDHSVCLVVKDRWFSLTRLSGVDGCTVTVKT